MLLLNKAFRKPLYLAIFIIALFTNAVLASTSQGIHFKSSDGLIINADSYTPLPSAAPLILLFHQAGSSRGEYNEIAPRLNKLGFNCIAVDLRSGEFSRGKDNQTSINASNAGLPTRYVDALADIIASIDFAHKQYKNSKLIIWRSSYSASLVIKVAGDFPERVDTVLAFSPGEYFSHQGKSKTWIRDSARNIKAPVFITSSKSETDSWQKIYDLIPANNRTAFIPASAGRHGSSALWSKNKSNEEYWGAISQFFTSAGFKLKY